MKWQKNARVHIPKLKPYFPFQITPLRSENFPNPLFLTLKWGRGGKEDGREKTEASSGEGEGVCESLSGRARKHVWETGQESLGKSNFNMWFVGKKEHIWL